MTRPLAVLPALLLLGMPLAAHHSLEAEYNPERTVTLHGIVTRVAWSNPHVRFFVQVKDDGRTGNWEVEMGSPNSQFLHGWKIDTVRPGDRVTITALPARDGSHAAFARSIVRTGQ